MKRTLALIAAVAFAAAAAQAQQTPAEKATAAAEAWLKIVDEGAYPEAYTKASEKWRKSSNEDVFSRLLRILRRNRGDFKSRSPISAEKMKGDIEIEGKKVNTMTVRFASEWSESKGTEVVNVIEEELGEWRVLNYGIQGGAPQGPKDKAETDKKEKGKKDKKDKKDQDKKD